MVIIPLICFNTLADKGRYNMRAFKVKIIPLPVKIDRQKIDSIKPVLLPVCLCLNKKHLLCQTIRGISLFRIAIPEVVLLKRHRGEFRICTDCPDGNELIYTCQPGLMHKLYPHHKIIVEEFSWMGTVCTNTAHTGCKMDNH